MMGAARSLPEEARRMIVETGIAYVATVCPDGRPNLSPKGTLKVIGENALAFADIASPGTIRNLAVNPGIEVNVLDPFSRRGYRFRGKATILHDPELIALLGSDLGEGYPIRAAVRIDVEDIRPLISPIYTLHGAKEAEVRRKWEAKLGYRRLHAEIPGTSPDAWSVASWEKFWSAPSPEVACSRVPLVVHEDVVAYWPAGARPAEGVAAYCRRVLDMLEIVPDLRLRLEEHASNGEHVFIRWTGVGTGPDGAFECSGIDLIRLRDGRVLENRIISDAPVFAHLARRTVEAAPVAGRERL